ncbi:exonuclease 1 [Primulina huaijiensis]|uniref:exonuclease 1 n=1 Tax=Primulina huaijiensis TaxID=1492673 RepID=UPI003CC73A10
MGIQGLLPLLKSIMMPIHVKELEGCFVAVDTYSWLHKGALSCSTDLCKGRSTSKHIDYCMHRVNMLRHYGVKPILVFDGGHLPMKSDQEIKRARSRKENLARAMEHESNGNLSAAYECYQKAVDISPSVAHDLIQVLKENNVAYVVAPYEADAQMTFLALSKQVEAVITEDSDLIAFGCPRIIYKMDKFGHGVEFKNTLLGQNKELDLRGFTQVMLLEMCILSGCDYLQSLPGMGLKKAHMLMKRFKCHEKVIKHLKYNCVEVTSLYEESFKKAIMTFKHQRVYDPVTEDIIHLSEPAYCIGDDLDFLGPSLPQHVVKGIALGDLDPFTKEPIQQECGAAERVMHGTYLLKNFKPDGERKKLDLPVQKNLLTNYFCFASMEAKREFRAPRITSNHPNGNYETSGPHLEEHNEVKCGVDAENSKFPESLDHGLWNGRVLNHTNITPITDLRNSLCKPCISLHKDLDSVQEGEQTRSGNKNMIVRSSYFSKKSKKESNKENEIDLHHNGDKNMEDILSNYAYKPLSSVLAGKCRKEEKKVTVRSSDFQQQNTKENANYEREKAVANGYRDLDADGEYGQATLADKKVIVRSSYFLKNPRKENNCGKIDIDNNDADKVEDVNKKCIKEEKRVIVSSYFQHKNIKEDVNCEGKKTVTEYAPDTCGFGSDAGDFKTTVDVIRSRGKIFYSKHKENLVFQDLVIRDDVSLGTFNNILETPSGYNSSEREAKKRKVIQTNIQTDNVTHKTSTTGTCTSDLDEETEAEEGNFSSDITHLSRYSDISEKSMERFISVISSFRYNPSGSRASGLRAPLKDIKSSRVKR